jgi:hypothetical protein
MSIRPIVLVLPFVAFVCVTAAAQQASFQTPGADSRAKNHRALRDLAIREKAERAAIHAQMQALLDDFVAAVRRQPDQQQSLREKFDADSEELRAQEKAIQDKYQTHRYALLEHMIPGSGVQMAHSDMLWIQYQQEMKDLSDQERAELSALPKPPRLKDERAIIDKYAAQRKAARDRYRQKLQESQP